MSPTSHGPLRTALRLAGPVLALTLAAVSASCDKVPLFAPSSSTITLTINRSNLPINGTAQVTATVIEPAGTSVQNGTLVTFVSNLGTFDPPEAETQGGRATVTFLAGTRSGTAQLSATSGGNRAANVEVLVGAAAAERVVVRTSPTSVPVTGGTVQVTSVVTDVSGNPLPGAQVVFRSDNGTLSSNSSLTDDNGEASATLTTNRLTVVTASVAGKEGTATVSAVSQPLVTIAGPAGTVTAGNPVAFTLTAPTPPTGTVANPIVALSVDFGDGQTRQLSPGSTSVTHVYNSPNTYVATARATDSTGLSGSSSTSVVVLERAGIPITLSASPLQPTPANPPNSVKANEIITFTVGNPPANAVSYTWNMGDGTSLVTTGTTANHRFGPDTQFRTVTVTVRTVEGGTGTASLQLRIIQ